MRIQTKRPRQIQHNITVRSIAQNSLNVHGETVANNVPKCVNPPATHLYTSYQFRNGANTRVLHDAQRGNRIRKGTTHAHTPTHMRVAPYTHLTYEPICQHDVRARLNSRQTVDLQDHRVNAA